MYVLCVYTGVRTGGLERTASEASQAVSGPVQRKAVPAVLGSVNRSVRSGES